MKIISGALILFFAMTAGASDWTCYEFPGRNFNFLEVKTREGNIRKYFIVPLHDRVKDTIARERAETNRHGGLSLGLCVKGTEDSRTETIYVYEARVATIHDKISSWN